MGLCALKSACTFLLSKPVYCGFVMNQRIRHAARFKPSLKTLKNIWTRFKWAPLLAGVVALLSLGGLHPHRALCPQFYCARHPCFWRCAHSIMPFADYYEVCVWHLSRVPPHIPVARQGASVFLALCAQHHAPCGLGATSRLRSHMAAAL